MNYYIVVEGRTEKTVYREWISHLNPSLIYVESVEQIRSNNYYIVSGFGYPSYFNTIESAIKDVNELGIVDELIIAVDSGEMNFEEKYAEISDFISLLYCRTRIRILIQHFCFEVWALGNRIIIRRNTSDAKLREYLRYFNIRIQDPELLPAYPWDSLNREKFAAKYLRIIINDRYAGITYNKNNPKQLLSKGYLDQVCNRHLETSHIASFSKFLRIFEE